ncbi:glycosyltransferase family 2 protein [Sphaerisporangium fuscum]|uniref:glycosyltransferase family 2 protein n=1 Tax=Sphaerisporangium fuscum TaxID=2835868 RepID=UPI001BDD34F9|nr:glycosyltransferase family 2 protein [Sphaerisporangium fuscum]
MTELSVVVLTYRSGAYVGTCLAALEKALAGMDAELIVVDNASGDGTVEKVRELAPWARVVARDVNDGFARGCHAGAEVAKGDYLLFVNPDARVSPDTPRVLVDLARRDPAVGIAGGRCLTETGETDPRSWWGRPTLWSLFCFGTGLSTLFPGRPRFDPESPRPWSGAPDEVRRVPIVTGGMMLVDRRVWDRLGGFDKSFFMYAEDADMCLRAAAAGYRPSVTAAATFVHPAGMSSSSSLRKQVLLFTGKVTLVRRHFPPVLRGLGVTFLKAGVLLRALAGRFMSAPGADRQGRPTTKADDWRGLWRARGQWTKGWSGART